MTYSQVEETNQQIDFEKLKKKEKIEYWDETILYEDELGDNGVAKYNVKIVSLDNNSTRVTLSNTVLHVLIVAESNEHLFLSTGSFLPESGWCSGTDQ